MTLQEQARQSGLFLPDTQSEWNEKDWPPLEGGWRHLHASVVISHKEKNNNNDDEEGETVVVVGGYHQGPEQINTLNCTTNSVHVLNLSKPEKQWQKGPPMKQKRDKHAAVVCNEAVYAVGGWNDENPALDCIEQIPVHDLLQSCSTSSRSIKGHWTTLNCRLSTGRLGCCAVAVRDRYIVVMGGWNLQQRLHLSSVEVIDTRTHTVTPGPRMNVPRAWFSSAVVGQCRIYVGGGKNEGGELDSVEYLDFAQPCNAEKAKDNTGASVISSSSSSSWTIHSDLVLSVPRHLFVMVAVGSCLVVAGGNRKTVEVLDTYRNRVWNLPPLGNDRSGCSMVVVANQVAVIGGWSNRTCATLPLMDKNTWCYRRLCEQHPNRYEWHHCLEGSGNQDAIVASSTQKREMTNTCFDKGEDGA